MRNLRNAMTMVEGNYYEKLGVQNLVKCGYDKLKAKKIMRHKMREMSQKNNRLFPELKLW